MPSSGTRRALGCGRRAAPGSESDPDGAAMTAITAASESSRSGDAKCSIAEHDRRRRRTSPRSTRARSRPGACRRTCAPRARGPGLVRLGAHAADHAGPQPGPVVGRRRRRRQPQRIADRAQLCELRAHGGQSWTCVSIAIISPTASSRSWKAGSRRRTAAQVKSVIHPSTGHAALSRARASRDLTVPTAMPSEKPISS